MYGFGPDGCLVSPLFLHTEHLVVPNTVISPSRYVKKILVFRYTEMKVIGSNKTSSMGVTCLAYSLSHTPVCRQTVVSVPEPGPKSDHTYGHLPE